MFAKGRGWLCTSSPLKAWEGDHVLPFSIRQVEHKEGSPARKVNIGDSNSTSVQVHLKHKLIAPTRRFLLRGLYACIGTRPSFVQRCANDLLLLCKFHGQCWRTCACELSRPLRAWRWAGEEGQKEHGLLVRGMTE